MYFQDLQAEFPEFYNQENEPTASSSRVGAHVLSNNQYENAADSPSNYRYTRGILPPHVQSIPVRLETPVREPLFFIPSSIQEPAITPGAPLLRPVDSLVHNMMPTNYVPLGQQQLLFRRAGMPGFVLDTQPGQFVYVPYVQYNHPSVLPLPAAVHSNMQILNSNPMFNSPNINMYNNAPNGLRFIPPQAVHNPSTSSLPFYPSQNLPVNQINTQNPPVALQTQEIDSSNQSVPGSSSQGSRQQTDLSSDNFSYHNIWRTSYEMVTTATDQLMREMNVTHPGRRDIQNGGDTTRRSTENTVNDYYISSIDNIRNGLQERNTDDTFQQQDQVAQTDVTENETSESTSQCSGNTQNILDTSSQQFIGSNQSLYSLPHVNVLTTALIDSMKYLFPQTLPEINYILDDERINLQELDHRHSSIVNPEVISSLLLGNVNNIEPAVINTAAEVSTRPQQMISTSSQQTLSTASEGNNCDDIMSASLSCSHMACTGYRDETVERNSKGYRRRRRRHVMAAVDSSPTKTMKTLRKTGQNELPTNLSSHGENLKTTINRDDLTQVLKCRSALTAGTIQNSPVTGTSQTFPAAGTSRTSGSSQTCSAVGNSYNSPVAATSRTSSGTSQTCAGSSKGSEYKCATSNTENPGQVSAIPGTSRDLGNLQSVVSENDLIENNIRNCCKTSDSDLNNIYNNQNDSTENSEKQKFKVSDPAIIHEQSIPTSEEAMNSVHVEETNLQEHPSMYDSLSDRAWRNRILFESQRYLHTDNSSRSSSASLAGRMTSSIMHDLYHFTTMMPDGSSPVASLSNMAQNDGNVRNDREEVYRLAGFAEVREARSDCSFSSTDAHASLSFSTEPETTVQNSPGPFQQYFHNLIYQFYIETFMWMYVSVTSHPRYVSTWALLELIGRGVRQNPADVLRTLLAGFLEGSISSMVTQIDMVDLLLQQIEWDRQVFPESIATLRDLSVLLYLRLDPSSFMRRFTEIVRQAARNVILQQEQPGTSVVSLTARFQPGTSATNLTERYQPGTRSTNLTARYQPGTSVNDLTERCEPATNLTESPGTRRRSARERHVARHNEASPERRAFQPPLATQHIHPAALPLQQHQQQQQQPVLIDVESVQTAAPVTMAPYGIPLCTGPHMPMCTTAAGHIPVCAAAGQATWSFPGCSIQHIPACSLPQLPPLTTHHHPSIPHVFTPTHHPPLPPGNMAHHPQHHQQQQQQHHHHHHQRLQQQHHPQHPHYTANHQQRGQEEEVLIERMHHRPPAYHHVPHRGFAHPPTLNPSPPLILQEPSVHPTPQDIFGPFQRFYAQQRALGRRSMRNFPPPPPPYPGFLLHFLAMLGNPPVPPYGRDLHDEATEENYEALLNLAERLGDAKPKGLCKPEIEQLPAYRFNGENLRNGADQTSCVVCMCDFENRQLLRVLPCYHEFHAKCIDKWLKTNRTCPICRADASEIGNQSD
ncbi:uncharacterized protein LOC123547138 isoform X1 [Mercenaria mercenaria]|uniref:uncharacterized protein LOC123547138 isoform X1 n=1 Tax=Mercenaria mercenaria TaxID=6596 RepID=UPI00234E3740|nr:uncharacterized protein LOC123547138 isoform X1 [Mercenaria mercenaria]